MPRNIARRALFLALVIGNLGCAAATLGDALRSANVSPDLFSTSELNRKITSFAVASGNPFLLAYYEDDGSGVLHPPLHVLRLDRASGELNRADLRDITALFQGEISMDCMGSALSVREHAGTIFIETHYNPSAGCLIMLSPALQFKLAVSGGLLGFVGAGSVIFRRSEVHFMSVHPLHINVFDLKRNSSSEVYPFPKDPLRREFSRQIESHISKKWCIEFNAQCDPSNFNIDLQGNVIVNEADRVFAFTARFNASGFGDVAQNQVKPFAAVYVFREHDGRWEHREFVGRPLERLLDGSNLEDLIARSPDRPFLNSSAR